MLHLVINSNALSKKGSVKSGAGRHQGVVRPDRCVAVASFVVVDRGVLVADTGS